MINTQFLHSDTLQLLKTYGKIYFGPFKFKTNMPHQDAKFKNNMIICGTQSEKMFKTDLVKSSHTGRLIITGISLGGGLAMISYVDVNHYNIFKNIEIITFGAPRVGNANWAKWFESIVQTDPVHICIKGDPICILPKCITPLCNYKHAGVGYSCDKNLEICTPKGKVSGVADSADSDEAEFDFEALVADLLDTSSIM